MFLFLNCVSAFIFLNDINAHRLGLKNEHGLNIVEHVLSSKIKSEMLQWVIFNIVPMLIFGKKMMTTKKLLQIIFIAKD